MSSVLNVKGNEIGNGKPMICVPVMGETNEDILSLINQYIDDGVKMIEWRVDAYKFVNDVNKIKEVLENLKSVLQNTVFVFTYRSKEQGGMGQVSEDVLKEIHIAGAEAEAVDFVDVEYFALTKPEKEIKQIQERGTYVISSHHDFDETPDSKVIKMLLEQMYESGADIVKLAVMPKNKKDVFVLMEQTAEFKEKYPKKPIISMSMGKEGVISRIAGELFGSCVTFASGNKASAPGQIHYSKLAELINIL